MIEPKTPVRVFLVMVPGTGLVTWVVVNDPSDNRRTESVQCDGMPTGYQFLHPAGNLCTIMCPQEDSNL